MLISFLFSITLTDIRHPEELSLLRPIEHKKKKKDKGSSEEVYDLTEVPLSSGTLTRLHLVFTYFRTWWILKSQLPWFHSPTPDHYYNWYYSHLLWCLQSEVTLTNNVFLISSQPPNPACIMGCHLTLQTLLRWSQSTRCCQWRSLRPPLRP